MYSAMSNDEKQSVALGCTWSLVSVCFNLRIQGGKNQTLQLELWSKNDHYESELV
jgi:hypothetical protein